MCGEYLQLITLIYHLTSGGFMLVRLRMATQSSKLTLKSKGLEDMLSWICILWWKSWSDVVLPNCHVSRKLP